MTTGGSDLRGPGRERGAGTLEYVGAVLVASVLVMGLLMTPASGTIGDSFQRAVCSVIQREGCGTTPASGQTPLEQATNGRYVAMGDSYSSGEGAWDYEEGTDFDDRDDLWPFNNDEEAHNRCHRSANAYSQVVGENNEFEGGTSFAACSGAEIPDLGDANASNTGEDPQLDSLGDDVSLVTLTLGGNDLGFADIMQDCILNGERGVPFVDTCQEKHDQRIEDELPLLMDALIARYAEIKAGAPNARVVIIGYPELFIEDPADNYGNALFREDMIWMNEKGAELNAMLREAAAEAGVEFIDPTEAFRGHGVGSDDPWINDLDIGGPGLSAVDPSSFHPNAAGQAAIAELVQQQLENPQYP